MSRPLPPKELQQAFAIFLEYGNAARLSRALRNLLLLILEYEDCLLPDDLKDLPVDLARLFDLLDKAEELPGK